MEASNCEDAEAHKGQFHAAANSPSLPLHCMDPSRICEFQPVFPRSMSVCVLGRPWTFGNGMTNRLTFFANFRDRCSTCIVIREPEIHRFL